MTSEGQPGPDDRVLVNGKDFGFCDENTLEGFE